MIKDEKADIVALNEVRGPFNDRTPNQAEELRVTLGDYWHLVVNEAMDYVPPQFCCTPDYPPYVWEGLAILSSKPYPMLQTGSLALKPTSGDNNRRIVQFASFALSGFDKPLYVFNCHMTLSPANDQYEKQLEEVLRYVGCFDGPKLLVGDLNRPREDNLCEEFPCVPEQLEPLQNAGWTDLWMLKYEDVKGEMGYTWQLVDEQAPPKRRLDYQWATADLLSAFVGIKQVARDPVESLYLSDHIGVMSEFRLQRA